MDKEVVKQIIETGANLLKQAAEVLGQTAAHVYGVLIKQQYAEGFGWILTFVVTLITLIILGLLMAKVFRQEKNKEISDNETGLWFIFLLALMIFMPFFMFFGFKSSIQKIVNPEYYAIKFLFDNVKSSQPIQEAKK